MLDREGISGEVGCLLYTDVLKIGSLSMSRSPGRTLQM